MLNLNVLIPPYLANLTGPTPCAGLDELFVGETVDARAAKPLCARCPVMEACGQWAIDTKEPAGIWGGMTPKERRAAAGLPAPAADAEGRDEDGRLPCGSSKAFRAHVRFGEECAVCQAVWEAEITDRRRAALDEEHRAGGSQRGYFLHRRLDEETCRLCRAAAARRSRETGAALRARRARERLAADPTPGAAEIDAQAPAQAAA